jgi:hypothetical protein
VDSAIADLDAASVGATFYLAVQEVIGMSAKRSAGKRGPQKKVRQQPEQIEALPVTKQRKVVRMIDACRAGTGRPLIATTTTPTTRPARVVCLLRSA